MADFKSLHFEKREHERFRDAGLDNEGRRLTKVAVQVENSDSEPIPVTWLDLPGDPVRLFDEVTTVAKNNLTTIISYTVPVASELTLAMIEVGGDNIAEYSVIIDGNKEDVKRSYFGGELDKTFYFQNTKIQAGKVIEVKVEHYRPDVGAFEAKIIGAVKNV